MRTKFYRREILRKLPPLAEIDHAFTPLNSRVDLKIKILVLHGNAGETEQDGLLASQLQWQHALRILLLAIQAIPIACG